MKINSPELLFENRIAAITVYFYHLMEILEKAPHCSCGAYSRVALVNFSTPCAALNRGRRLFEVGAYWSKYGSSTEESLLLLLKL